jgi:hypothetical protein
MRLFDLLSLFETDVKLATASYILVCVHVYARLKPLKTEFLLNNIYKFSSYLTGKKLRLRYKAKPDNTV